MRANQMLQLLEGFAGFTEILDRIPNAIYIIDKSRKQLYINRAAEKLDGYTKQEAFGRTVEDLYGLKYAESPILMALTSGENINDFVFRYVINGKEIIQLCNAGPIRNNGEIIGAYTIQRDVTLMKEVIERNISLQKEIFDIGKHNKTNTTVELIGKSPNFLASKELARKVAQTDSAVMLIADTGCGKEMFAKYIHFNSGRKGPFLALNCAAIPESLLESLLFGTAKGAFTGAVEREGLFEQAEGGTLFLDEINSMPLSSQAKLLRVLEDKTVQHLGGKEQINVNVRIISSSNIPAEEAIRLNHIRSDLFYRLAVVNICIPPLSQRIDDIYLLTHYFISIYNQSFGKHIMGLEDDITSYFLNFTWPGNVRQLKHCIESAMNFVGDKDCFIQKQHLPPYIFNENDENFTGYRQNLNRSIHYDHATDQDSSDSYVKKGLLQIIQEKEREDIIDALFKCKGNVSKAAKLLDIHRNALIYRIKKYDIKL